MQPMPAGLWEQVTVGIEKMLAHFFIAVVCLLLAVLIQVILRAISPSVKK